MKRALLLGVIVFAIPQALAGSIEACPKLPSDSGFEWRYSEGPDFDVCRAYLPGSEESAFGIYLGNHPSFHPERSNSLAHGKVAGRPVTWYRHDQNGSASALSRQTLLILNGKHGYIAHIWVNAEDEQQLLERLSTLQRIVFDTP